MIKNTLLLALSLLLSALLPAQNPVKTDCKLRIGTNLSGPADWGSEWPFVNIMKYGRTWNSCNNQWINGGKNEWDTQLIDKIPTDAQGYPLSLPINISGAEAPQIVRSVWANTEDLPVGRYVVLFDGEGKLGVWGDAKMVSQTSGRMEFDLTHGNDIFTLELRESKAGNHVRNIRVLLPGTEQTYQQEPFSAQWLEKLAPFGVLRFMDWGYTNNSTMRQWSQRTQSNDYTWTQKSGVPYEWWIELCNRKKSDVWVCVPHAASDDYITKMATLFRDQMNPGQKIYVEWSNEVWNWIFSQASYGLDSLPQNLPWPERHAPRIERIMQIWTDVFKGQEQRLVRIMASQHAWWDLGERTMAQIKKDGKAHLIDAISPAAYMGLDEKVMAQWNASTTGLEVIKNGANFTFDPNEHAMKGWKAYAKPARDNGKKLLFYEGGQHFTPAPFGSEQAYCPALLSCQTLPEMYDLYQQLFDTLRTLSNQEMLLMNFSFISPQTCRYGSWGALQSQFFENPPYSNAPKYLAILEANKRYKDCKASVYTKEHNSLNTSILPNPVHDFFTVNTDVIWERTILYNALGQALKTYSNGEKMSVAGLPSGSYLLTLMGTQNTYIQTLKISVE
jgi:hypothetical protein